MKSKDDLGDKTAQDQSL